MSLGALSIFYQESDAKTVSKIDEILERSRKVVEESIELSKKSAEQRVKLDSDLEVLHTAENSMLLPKKIDKQALGINKEYEDKSPTHSYKNLIEDLDAKIKFYEKKACEDEKIIENLRAKSRYFSEPTTTDLEIIQCDKTIQTLEQMISVGLIEENKKLKNEINTLLKAKNIGESKENKNFEEMLKDKTPMSQISSFKHLYNPTTDYKEEIECAKTRLNSLEKEATNNILKLEKKIKEQIGENSRLMNLIRASSEKQKTSNVKIKPQKYGKNSLSCLKKKY